MVPNSDSYLVELLQGLVRSNTQGQRHIAGTCQAELVTVTWVPIQGDRAEENDSIFSLQPL